MCGFTGGGLVKYSRHNYCAEFSLTAPSGGQVVKVGYNTSLLITAGADRQLKVWRLEDGRALCELSHPGGTVQDMKVGREKIVTASPNKSLYVHQVKTVAQSGEVRLRTLLRLRGHTRSVTCLDYQTDWVLSGALDKTVRLWSVSGFNQHQYYEEYKYQHDDHKLLSQDLCLVITRALLPLLQLPALLKPDPSVVAADPEFPGPGPVCAVWPAPGPSTVVLLYF